MADPKGRGGGRKAGWRGCALGAVLAVLSPSAGVAADLDFMGVAVEPLSGIYEATKDVNVRAGPDIESDRIGQVGPGTELEAVGRAKGGWIAVRRGGRDLGFVYESYVKSVKQVPLERDKAGRLVGVGGKPLAAASGRFLAVDETVVRAKPTADSAKNGDLERGTRVEAMGASDDGKWLAVRWGGREMGFVPRQAVLPLIDGDLRTPVTGTAKTAKDGTCSFTIRFVGKSAVADDIIETADYDVDWKCDIDGRKLGFPGFMFITEAPFQLADNQVYQISVDLLNVSPEYDEAFSTIFLYRRGEAKVVFDSVSIKELAVEPKARNLPAKSVREALAGAATLAPAAWAGDVWTILAEETP